MKTFYRITIFATAKKGKKTIGSAWELWNPDRSIEEALGSRLPGAGSFYWSGLRSAWRRAVVALRQTAGATQAKIETIGGRPVARLYGRADGITAYALDARGE